VKSATFKSFGIPDTECEIEVADDPHGIRRLWFRSDGNPLVGVDFGGALKMRDAMISAGESENAASIDGLIAAGKAR
jgi:hypothetical protein